jgi:hypothetical protein
MNQITTIEDRIAAKIDQNIPVTMMVSDHAGGVRFSDFGQLMEFSKIMAASGIGVPKHLRGNVGACMRIAMQAIEWRMSPYAVADKSYFVNDKIAYEAQLFQAVILQRAPIKGRIKVEYTGLGSKRACRVWAVLNDGSEEIVEYQSPEFGAINPKNSPLWKNDPDQQLFYFSVRSLARRHFPDVVMGIYTKDELEDAQVIETSPQRHATVADQFSAITSPAHKQEAQEQPIGIDVESDMMRYYLMPNQGLTDLTDEEEQAVSNGSERVPSTLTEEITSMLTEEATSRAQSGTAALKSWWEGLTTCEKNIFKTHMDKFKKQAQEVDDSKSKGIENDG